MNPLSLIGRGVVNAGRGIATGVNKWVDYSSAAGLGGYLNELYPEGVPDEVRGNLRRSFLNNLGQSLAAQNPAALGMLQREDAQAVLTQLIAQKQRQQFQQSTSNPDGSINYDRAAQWYAQQGMAEDAARYANLSENLRSGAAQRKTQDLNNAQVQLALAGQVLGPAKNQAEWTAGIESLRAHGISINIPPMYSPQFAQKLGMQSMSYVQQLGENRAQKQDVYAANSDRRADTQLGLQVSADDRQKQLFPYQLEQASLAPQQTRLGMQQAQQAVDGTTPISPYQKEELNLQRARLNAEVNAQLFARQQALRNQMQQDMTGEGVFRREFNSQIGDHVEMSNAFSKVLASAGGGAAGDIGLIFGYMKLLDPGSTVREGEQATARNAGSIPERVRALYNRAVAGETFSDETRRQFVDNAAGLIKSQLPAFDALNSRYQGIAKQYNIDPNRITYNPYLPALRQYQDYIKAHSPQPQSGQQPAPWQMDWSK